MRHGKKGQRKNYFFSPLMLCALGPKIFLSVPNDACRVNAFLHTFEKTIRSQALILLFLSIFKMGMVHHETSAFVNRTIS